MDFKIRPSPTHAYSYDPAGNRNSSLAFGQTTSYTASSVNAYTSINGGGFQPPVPAYDPNGNALTLPRPDGVCLSLTWSRTATPGQPATDEDLDENWKKEYGGGNQK